LQRQQQLHSSNIAATRQQYIAATTAILQLKLQQQLQWQRCRQRRRGEFSTMIFATMKIHSAKKKEENEKKSAAGKV